MNPEIVNLYIEKLINYVSDLTKTNILLSAQLTFYEKQLADKEEKLKYLEQSLDKALLKTKKRDLED